MVRLQVRSSPPSPAPALAAAPSGGYDWRAPGQAIAGPRPDMKTILVTGALGQIGSELVPALRERYGAGEVIASDIRMPPVQDLAAAGRFEFIDCTNPRQIQDRVRTHDVG